MMHRLSNMPEDSIHAEILRDNMTDAQEHPSYGNWAGGIVNTAVLAWPRRSCLLALQA